MRKAHPQPMNGVLVNPVTWRHLGQIRCGSVLGGYDATRLQTEANRIATELRHNAEVGEQLERDHLNWWHSRPTKKQRTLADTTTGMASLELIHLDRFRSCLTFISPVDFAVCPKQNGAWEAAVSKRRL